MASGSVFRQTHQTARFRLGQRWQSCQPKTLFIDLPAMLSEYLTNGSAGHNGLMSLGEWGGGGADELYNRECSTDRATSVGAVKITYS